MIPLPFETRSHTPMKEPAAPRNPLSALEISGAVCAKIIHDLSTLIGGIVGNAEYATTMAGDPARLQKALQAITVSANSAGKLLGQCLPLQRLISGEAFPVDVREQALHIAESGNHEDGWRVLVPDDLSGQIRVQPVWLSAAIWQLVHETQASCGEIKFNCGPAVFPVVWRGSTLSMGRTLQLFQITLHFRAEQMLVPIEGQLPADRPGLLAAHELVRTFKSQIHYRSKPPGRQEISILIPLL
ncbi:MAG: hypothetical protein JWQ71_875 [Pedosphaera sp.]|nr:hypothetical protein [Pedosphaera sp.]